MDCPSCLRRISTHLDGIDGVVSVEGSPVQRTLTVELDPHRTAPRRVREEVGRLGYSATDRSRAPSDAGRSAWTGPRARIVYVSLGFFVLGWVLRLAGVDPRLFALPLHDVHLPDILFLGSALVGGLNFFPRGLRAARTLALDMNFLMTVAILGAVGIGEYVEAAAIAFLFALADLLESYAVDRARGSVEALMELAPDTGRVRRGGEVVVVPADELEPGDVVEVRPGDRIPVDGEVVEGASAVDQSAVTGESMPVEKTTGAQVYGGTVNREGFLAVRVVRPAAESTLARIIHLVEEAETHKSPTEHFVERFARWYTPAVTVAAILTVVVPVLLGEPFVPWFTRGLTLLVIACPCALVISTPVAVVSGVTAAARNGVLIKGGAFLEALGGVRAVAVDKTGTLTVGHPRVSAVHPAAGVDGNELLARAAALESRSEHPLARAVADHARREGMEAVREATDFTSVPGKGVRGRVDGVEHRVGRPAFAAPGHPVPPEVDGAAATVLAVATDDEVLGWITVADQVRDAAPAAVDGLRTAGVEHVVMLTGDRQEVAEAVGREAGVDEVRAELLPDDKVEAVAALEARYDAVAMVGDGVNDAPALARSTVGVVMGAAGSDAALETADVALMGDDLSKLPWVRDLSARARRIIRQNIAAAILVKAVLAVGVPLGFVSLITAVVVGDLGVSLAVTLNALRLGGRRHVSPVTESPRVDHDHACAVPAGA
jgi:Cd2+/Zn2+-exporting ATPase